MAPYWGLLPLDTNTLETPLGDCRCRGLLLQDTQSSDVRGSFYWTPTGGAHPQVATTLRGSFHWTLGHLTYLFVSFSISQEFWDRRQPPSAVAGTEICFLHFRHLLLGCPYHLRHSRGLSGLLLGGGGTYLCQTLGSVLKWHLFYSRPGCGLVGVNFGWECSPTTLVA